MSRQYIRSKYICDGVTLLKTAYGEKHVAIDLSLADKLSVARLATKQRNYLMFDEQSACLALFELADFATDIVTASPVSWLGLNNALCERHADYLNARDIRITSEARDFVPGKSVMHCPEYGNEYLEI